MKFTLAMIWWVAGVGLVLPCASRGQNHEIPSPSIQKAHYVAWVKDVWKQCLQALEKPSHTAFYRVLEPRMDFEYGLKQALGRSVWLSFQELPLQKREAYKKLWQRYSVGKFRRALKACRPQDLTIVGFYETQGYPCVETEVELREGMNCPVVWVFSGQAGQYLVIDLHVAGVSLMADEREILGQYADQGGLEAVFGYMQAYSISEKN